jgi:hypothetical protein
MISSPEETRPCELDEPVKSSFMQLNAGTGGLALVLMDVAVSNWRKAKNYLKWSPWLALVITTMYPKMLISVLYVEKSKVMSIRGC